MGGYVLRRGDMGHYLQWHPASRTFEFTAAELRHATPLTLEAARVLLDRVTDTRAYLAVDTYRTPLNGWRFTGREPQFDLDTLPAEFSTAAMLERLGVTGDVDE